MLRDYKVIEHCNRMKGYLLPLINSQRLFFNKVIVVVLAFNNQCLLKQTMIKEENVESKHLGVYIRFIILASYAMYISFAIKIGSL